MAAVLTDNHAFHNAITYLISPVFTTLQTSCLSFLYYSSTALSLSLKAQYIDAMIFILRKGQGPAWHEAHINIAPGQYHLYFEIMYPYSHPMNEIPIDEGQYLAGIDNIMVVADLCENKSEYIEFSFLFINVYKYYIKYISINLTILYVLFAETNMSKVN